MARCIPPAPRYRVRLVRASLAIDRRPGRPEAWVMTQMPQPVRGADGASILGPRNADLQRENPDILVPPQTDSGTLPNLKYSFEEAHNRLLTGGWAREVTVRELPIATELAGVNMRLKPG